MVLHRKIHDTMVEPSKKNIADESKKEWADATDEWWTNKATRQSGMKVLNKDVQNVDKIRKQRPRDPQKPMLQA